MTAERYRDARGRALRRAAAAARARRSGGAVAGAGQRLHRHDRQRSRAVDARAQARSQAERRALPLRRGRARHDAAAALHGGRRDGPAVAGAVRRADRRPTPPGCSACTRARGRSRSAPTPTSSSGRRASGGLCATPTCFRAPRHSVYAGRELRAWPQATIRRGELVFESGKMLGAARQRPSRSAEARPWPPSHGCPSVNAGRRFDAPLQRGRADRPTGGPGAGIRWSRTGTVFPDTPDVRQ